MAFSFPAKRAQAQLRIKPLHQNSVSLLRMHVGYLSFHVAEFTGANYFHVMYSLKSGHLPPLERARFS